MGSKSSSAPAPDPRLVEAQINSMGIQNTAIARMMDNSAYLLPIQREQMQFGLDAARTAFGQAQADRDFALSRRAMLSGIQDRIANQANTFDEAGRREQLAGEGAATITQGLANSQAMALRSAGRYGLNSSAMANAFSNAGVQAAKLKALSANMARDAARAEGLQLTDRANNALAGYPAMASGLSGSGASFGGMGLNLANTGLAGMNSGYNAAGGMAGNMGANATGMFNAQASYKNAQDQMAASNDPFNTILGAATGAGMAYLTGGLSTMGKNAGWANSDPRLKTNVERVGFHEGAGLNLYEFNYLNDPSGKRYRGVMADEVQRFYPSAVRYDDLGFASVNYTMLGIEMVEV